MMWPFHRHRPEETILFADTPSSCEIVSYCRCGAVRQEHSTYNMLGVPMRWRKSRP